MLQRTFSLPLRAVSELLTLQRALAAGAGLVLMLSAAGQATAQEDGSESAIRAWRAGDHHIHTRWSVGWDDSEDPPAPIVFADAIYPTPMNALMARHYGLDWMVTTDHGGPNHSKLNLERAYPELLQSRTVVPDVIQFYGMEFDTPGADHSSFIIPHSHHESDDLYEIERRYDKVERYPADPAWDTEERMIEALEFVKTLPLAPVHIAHHASRSATELGVYRLTDPEELRDWNDTAPNVSVGMEGAPGHQAAAINPDGSIDPDGARGGYRNYPTMGGFDQMTARLGGFWDSMLGEGRRWWITATSDSHVHWREGGSDFWPGEYSKTYVYAEKGYDDILDGIRGGRVFVTTGDLVSELHVTATTASREASIGGTLPIDGGADVTVTIRLRDPSGTNHHGDDPSVVRVDLIVGEITGPVDDRSQDTNPTTRVVRRFTADDWSRDGEVLTMTVSLEDVHHSSYLRVRGTNQGGQLEPEVDPRGEDPWTDLWFYSNPIFMEVE